jgi:hypothetical protein
MTIEARRGGGGDRDHAGLEFQTLVDQGREPVPVVVRREVAARDAAAVHVAEVLKALKEPVESGRARLQRARIEGQEAEAGDVLELRARGEGHREDAGQAPEKRAPVHTRTLRSPCGRTTPAT